MIASLILGTLSSILYLVGNGAAIFLAGRIVWGFAWSLLWIGGNTMVLVISSEQNRGLLRSLFQTWFLISVASSSFLGGLFTDLFGFKGGLTLSTALIGLAAVFWFFFLPETRPCDRSKQNKPKPIHLPKNSIWINATAISLPLFAVHLVFAGVLASTVILWLEGLAGEQLNFGLIRQRRL